MKYNPINYNNEKYFLDLVEGGILIVTYEGKVFNNKTGNWIGKKPNSHGYHSIGYKVSGKTIHQLIHRLVFLVHGGVLTDEFPLINHIDGNKSNNHFENLEASNYSHNSKHAYDTGLTVFSEKTRMMRVEFLSGEKGPAAKITNNQAKEIREKYLTGNYTHRSLAKEYGVAHKRIGEILRCQTFKNI